LSRVHSILGLCLILATAGPGCADTIYLKNGMYIIVRKAEEKDGQIEYWVGSTKYTIAKGAVAKIEPGDGPAKRPVTSGSPMVEDLTRRDAGTGTAPKHDKLQLPIPSGPKEDAYWAALRNRITTADTIDNMRLAEIERDNDVRTTTNAYFLAGVMAMQQGNVDQASGYFEHALQATPEQANLLEWHAIALASQLTSWSMPQRCSPILPCCFGCWRWHAMTRIAPPMPSRRGSA
jgi:hypothetical protein